MPTQPAFALHPFRIRGGCLLRIRTKASEYTPVYDNMFFLFKTHRNLLQCMRVINVSIECVQCLRMRASQTARLRMHWCKSPTGMCKALALTGVGVV